MSGAKILYLDSYTKPSAESIASDEIGYGITAGNVIKTQLRLMGYTVHDLHTLGIEANSKLSWIQASYTLLNTLPLNDYDAIFIFHAFHQFPCEVRRIVLERGLSRIKIVGYTHGSHWDETDTIRTIFYPNMHVADLANLMCMDRVFVVSQYFRNVLLQSISHFSIKAAEALEPRLVVTGLPLNNSLIDQYQSNRKQDRVEIVFNHSPTDGKDPARFFRLMKHVLAKYPISLIVTRAFHSNSPGGGELQELCRLYPNQVVLGNTLSISEYYTTLWMTSIQVSTALHESFGVATIEAMYTKNCCLLPNSQSYPEVTGGLGLYSSDSELLEMLSTYILDKTSRDRMGDLMRMQSMRYLPQPVMTRISDAIMSTLDE